ncbi:MAG: tetratricopeptide repeat protein [Opitutus sp.]|nr:tetratricopeptide repeat protein [Opitutus sp.]
MPYLAPVVIDDTSESGAAVPAEFMRVQWTRLPGALPTPQFVEQMKRLLAPTTAMEVGRPRPAKRDEGVASPAKPPVRIGVLAAVAVIALGLIAAFFATRSSPRSAASSVAAKPPLDLSAAGLAKADKSIAVLPFTNMSDDKDSGFFADGVHEDILTSLYLIPDLKVTSRTSVAQYRDTKKTMRQIGQELGVTYILEGSVRRDGKTVRVTGQLIRAGTDEHLWAKRYDKEWKDLFGIQSELAQAIAVELQAKLSPETKKLLDRRPTENAAAYDLFLKAREARNYSDPSIDREEKIESLLTAAVSLDPAFALAWADLAWEHGWRYINNKDRTPARLANAKAAIDTALRLAPGAPEVILDLGYYHYFGHREYARASEHFEKVRRRQPNAPAPHFALGLVQRRMGKWAEALESFRAAAQLDPANVDYADQFQGASTTGKRWDLALTEQRRICGLLPKSSANANWAAKIPFLAQGSTREMEALLADLSTGEADAGKRLDVRWELALMRGDHAEIVRVSALLPTPTRSIFRELRLVNPVAAALAAQGDRAGVNARLETFPAKLRARLELEPENDYAWSALGMVEALLGHPEAALRCARKAIELVPESLDALHASDNRLILAFVYAWTGDKEKALEEYARLLRAPVYMADELNVHVMKHHPYYFPLQGDPRFEALLNDPKNNAPLF